MTTQEELKKIKHIYGEEFMQLCRELFPTILDDKGMLLTLLSENFANNTRCLARDIKEQDMKEAFADFVFTRYDKMKHKDDPTYNIGKTPFEILDEAGYTLYEAHNEREIQSFVKYYAPGEELCTFDGGRLNRCVCFWAIKDNYEEIEHGVEPQREDEYSTSVLAIQFTRYKKSRVSIKSRYNHAVDNPDATFGNDLERLAPGLTESFNELLRERGYGVRTKEEEEFELRNYTIGVDGKYYRYNVKANGVYYCPGNIILTNERIETIPNPEQEVLIDNYILNLKTKTLEVYDTGKFLFKDYFSDSFFDIKRIERTKDKLTGDTTFMIYQGDNTIPCIITVDNLNRITGYENENLTAVGNGFMIANRALKEFKAPNLVTIGNNFLGNNRALEKLELPNLKIAEDYFLLCNRKLKSFVAPKLEDVGSYFLGTNKCMEELDLPALKEVENEFMFQNRKLEKINIPNLQRVGWGFLLTNHEIKNFDAPSLEEVGQSFLYYNKKMTDLNMPKLKIAEGYFMSNNTEITSLEFPELREVGACFLLANQKIDTLIAPKLEIKGWSFMGGNSRFDDFMPGQIIVGGDIARLDRLEKVTKTEITKIEKEVKKEDRGR